ncbi:hypothetical protein GN958_ATG00814, partial [Phytophthora infestans]
LLYGLKQAFAVLNDTIDIQPKRMECMVADADLVCTHERQTLGYNSADRGKGQVYHRFGEGRDRRKAQDQGSRTCSLHSQDLDLPLYGVQDSTYNPTRLTSTKTKPTEPRCYKSYRSLVGSFIYIIACSTRPKKRYCCKIQARSTRILDQGGALPVQRLTPSFGITYRVWQGSELAAYSDAV